MLIIPFPGTLVTRSTSSIRLGALFGRRSFAAASNPTALRPPAPPPLPSASHPQQQQAQGQRRPKLVEIPKLPVFGSLIPFHSGLTFDFNRWSQCVRSMSKTYGDFYSLGIPGVGSDVYGTFYVTNDPAEMIKVIRQEGAYPYGAAEEQWLLKAWMKARNFTAGGIYGRGPEWKRIRNFLQKDMLSPQSAREYAPAMLRAAASASPKAAEWAEKGEILRYLQFCAMDLFSSVHFGTRDDMPEEDYETYCRAAVDSLKNAVHLSRDPLVWIVGSLGIRTPAVRNLFESLDTIHEISVRRQKQVLDRIRSGQQVSAEDRESYFYKSLQRLKESDDVSLDELIEIGHVIMMSSVDTTSSKTAWNLLQLVLNPVAQERLRAELLRAVEREGGGGGAAGGSPLTPAVLDTPYLKAFIRETHRCTPTMPIVMLKKLESPTEIHEVELPTGSTVCFDGHSPQLDPDLVEDPMAFRPERWLSDAVEARKGTPAALLDHPFFSGPFSQGARRCPGSRVAYLEVQAVLAQLLLDWRIEGPDDVHWDDVPSTMETVLAPVFPREVRFVPAT